MEEVGFPAILMVVAAWMVNAGRDRGVSYLRHKLSTSSLDAAEVA